MIGWDAALQADVAEKNFRSLIFTAHRNQRNQAHAQNHTPTASQNDFFSSLLELITAPGFRKIIKKLECFRLNPMLRNIVARYTLVNICDGHVRLSPAGDQSLIPL